MRSKLKHEFLYLWIWFLVVLDIRERLPFDLIFNIRRGTAPERKALQLSTLILPTLEPLWSVVATFDAHHVHVTVNVVLRRKRCWVPTFWIMVWMLGSMMKKVSFGENRITIPRNEKKLSTLSVVFFHDFATVPFIHHNPVLIILEKEKTSSSSSSSWAEEIMESQSRHNLCRHLHRLPRV